MFHAYVRRGSIYTLVSPTEAREKRRGKVLLLLLLRLLYCTWS